MKLWNKICDYFFDVPGRLVFIAGIVVSVILVVVSVY